MNITYKHISHFINNLLVYAYNVYHECVLHYQLENRYIHRIYFISIVYFNYVTWKISTVLHFVTALYHR